MEYTKEDREKHGRLAEMMGWRNINWLSGELVGNPGSPTDYGNRLQDYPPVPNYDKDETAKAQILHWLAEDGSGPGSQFHDFIEELREIVPGLSGGLIWHYGYPTDADNPLSAPQIGWMLTFEGLLLAMTASPAQIAEATIRALKL